MTLGIRQSMQQETVAALAIRKPITVSQNMSVREVAAQLRSRQLGCAIIVDAANKPVGKFTQRLLMKVLVENPAQLEQPVASVMYREADTIALQAPLTELVQRMSERQVRYLTVVDAQGKVVGLTGQKGLAEYMADRFPRHVKVQRMKPLISLAEREGA